jgi:predicted MFS family arabinose efflux permease
MTRKEKILLSILAIIKFVHIMDFMIMMPLGPQLMKAFNISPAQFGAIVSSYGFSAGIFGFVGAFFIDKFDRKVALVYLFAGFTIGTLSCAFAPTHHWLIAARIFTGAFGGILGALVLSIVADQFPAERRSSAMGVIMGAFSAASVLGVPFGLYMASIYNWQAPFMLLGGISIAIFIAILFVVPSLRAHLDEVNRRSPVEFLVNIYNKRSQQLALLLMVLLMFGQFSIVPYIAPYMVSNVGFTELQLTYIYLLGGAVTLITSPLIGRWADNVGNVKMFTIMGLLALIPIALITNLPQVPIYVALIPTTMFFIFIGGRMIPALTIITSTAMPQNRGGFMTIVTSLQNVASAAAAFLAGLIIVKNDLGQLEQYAYVGGVAITASIACIVLIRYIAPAPLQPTPTETPIQTAPPADIRA